VERYRLDETLASLPSEQVMAVAVVAIALAVYRPTWNVLGYPVTIVHELGHALAALVVGYRLHGITVNSDMSGATNFAGRGTFRVLWTMWWGYPAPAVAGAALLWAAAEGWAKVALAVLVAFLLLTFLLSRSWHTVVVVLATGVSLGLIGWYGEPWLQNIVVFGLAWLLFVGSVRALWSVSKAHATRRGLQSSDAYLMSRHARIVPGAIWLLTFFAAIAAAGWFGISSIASVVDLTTRN
jgi:hypothetical protein